MEYRVLGYMVEEIVRKALEACLARVARRKHNVPLVAEADQEGATPHPNNHHCAGCFGGSEPWVLTMPE